MSMDTQICIYIYVNVCNLKLSHSSCKGHSTYTCKYIYIYIYMHKYWYVYECRRTLSRKRRTRSVTRTWCRWPLSRRRISCTIWSQKVYRHIFICTFKEFFNICVVYIHICVYICENVYGQEVGNVLHDMISEGIYIYIYFCMHSQGIYHLTYVYVCEDVYQ
jgi:hypothetical protein